MHYYNGRVLLPKNFNLNDIAEKIEIYRWLGYTTLYLEQYNSENIIGDKLIDEISSVYPAMRLYQRVYFKADSINKLKRKLSRAPNKRNVIISVASKETDILNFAAHDSRVQLLSASSIRLMNAFSDGTVSLVKQHGKFVEFSLIDAINVVNGPRSRVFRDIHKFLTLTRPIQEHLIYAGAERWLKHIRGPRELMSVLTSVFGLKKSLSKRIFTENPNRLNKKNKEMKTGILLHDGVRILRDSENGDRDA